MATRILSWNLQGRAGPDLEVVGAEIAGSGADVVALQEVQRGQARWLAASLGWSLEWRFKHWPVVVAPEGLALLSTRPLSEVATVHLAHPFRVWSSRRRIAVRATVEGGDGPLVVVAAHLGAGVSDGEKARQAAVAVGALRGATAPGCVVGDLNARPGSAVLATFAEHGLRDAWAEVRPGQPGPTIWARRPRDQAPNVRLDFALVGDGLEVLDAAVPAFGEAGFERYGTLSDHLPLTVTVAPRAS